MGSWKLIAMTVLLLIPGGTLVLLALAAAKLFRSRRDGTPFTYAAMKQEFAALGEQRLLRTR